MTSENLKTPVTEEELASRAVAPRVTSQAIEDTISAEHYFTAYEGVLGERFVRGEGESDAGKGRVPKTLGLLTFCVMTLKNGFTVVGKSASASFENFNPEIGKRIAREDATRQIWVLLGYQLRDRLNQLGEISASDQTLGDALTHLLAAQLGNPDALKPHHCQVIINHFDPTHFNSDSTEVVESAQ